MLRKKKHSRQTKNKENVNEREQEERGKNK